MAVDSGAAESVMPVGEVPEYTPVQHPEQIYYQTASGETLANEGEQCIPMCTAASSQWRSMTFQTCDVTKPLASVKRIVDTGHIVVLAPSELGGSYILNLSDWSSEPLTEEDGNYNLEIWVPEPELLSGFGRHP